MFRKLLMVGVVALGCSLVLPESAEAWRGRGPVFGRGPVRVNTGYRGWYGAPSYRGYYGPRYGYGGYRGYGYGPRYYGRPGVSVNLGGGWGGGGWGGW
jgi:hypothetical protein